MAEMDEFSIPIDKDLQEDAKVFFADLGLNLTTAVNLFVRQTLRQGKIPFEILGSTDPFYCKENMRALEESLQQLREGKVVHKTMDELLAMEAEVMEREAVKNELAAAK